MSSNNDNNNENLEPNKAATPGDSTNEPKTETNQEKSDEIKPEDVAKTLEASLLPDGIKSKTEEVIAPIEEIKPLPKRKTLSIIIHDAGVLRAAYMQFMKSGGLFIPTKIHFTMGDNTNLVIRLLDDDEPYRVTGKVVWITPSTNTSNKASGIGVEFSEDKNGERLRSRIEVILGPHLKSQESTHTM